jgi:hypothetical protein
MKTVEEVLKEIVEEFKAEGLDVAEESVIRMVKVAFKAIPKVVEATETKLDDLLVLPLISLIEKPVFKALDKINKKQDL